MFDSKNKNKKNIFLKKAFFCFVFVFFFFPLLSLAGSIDFQRCEPDTDCILGEYVFDDDGTPVDSQACTIDIKDPSGGVVVDDASMDFESDGWHSYTVNISSPEGLYRSMMCCTFNAKSACLDKSFTLGVSFESLSDIESDTQLIRRSTFDFAGFADAGSTSSTLVDAELVQPDDYWNDYILVMITGDNAGEEATITDFNSTTNTLSFSAFSYAVGVNDEYILRHDEKLILGVWNSANRTLTSAANVAGDIWGYSTRTLSSFGSLAADVWSDTFASTRTLTSKTLSGGENLSTESNDETIKDELITEIGNVETNLTSTGESLKDELMAEIGVVEASIAGTDIKVDAVLVDTGNIENKVDTVLVDVGNIEDKIDTVLVDTGNIEDKIDAMSELDSKTTEILAKWGEYDAEELSSQISDIYDQVKEVSTSEISSDIEDLTAEINDNLDETKSLQNKAIEIKAMIALNRSLIENKPVVKTFYEWGSVVLKVVVANPSDTKQTINFRSALPKEIRPDDIINKSNDLKLEFDAENDRWFATGSVKLAGDKSETKFVEVRDIWKISDDEIASLRRESEDLSEPLRDTAFYAQSVTIKNDIASRLDRINLIQSQESITPEEHILNYRENIVEIETVKKNIESLKELVASTSNGDNFKGSLMGISTTMTWAIILVVIVGVGILLIFLVIALRERRIGGYNKNENVNFDKLLSNSIDKNDDVVKEEKNDLDKLDKKKLIKKILIDVLIFILSVAILSTIFYFYKNWGKFLGKDKKEIIISENEIKDEVAENKKEDISKEVEDGKSSEEEVNLPESSSEVEISSDETTASSPKKVKVKETETGWLNMREEPSLTAAILKKIDAGTEPEYLSEQEGWINIKTEDGEEGWVSDEYVEILDNE